MNISNKTFKNNKTGEIIKVIDAFENIAILENKQKMDVNTLLNSNLYTEQIDPNNFFSNQSAYNFLAEKIKNIPTHMMAEEDGSIPVSTNNFQDGFQPMMNESAIIMTNEEDERAELARKYNLSNNQDSSIQKQNEAFSKILGEENIPDFMTNNNNQNLTTNEVIQRIEVNRFEEEEKEPVQVKNVVNNLPGHSNPPQPATKVVEVEDPIITMFRKTKRNVDLNISFNISEKIPRTDFIEMMEDSYETSMIDFLADEFTNKIIQNPLLIKQKIKDEIESLVYGEKGKLESFPTPVNNQITDSVTQIHDTVETKSSSKTTQKRTTTPKPRAKKETTKE
jgi:hypothetical protein